MRKLTPATIISLVALFVSLGGTGWAASRWLITSTSQIKPSVRHALRGERGRVGPAGTIGPQGVQGVPGPEGPQGTAARVDLSKVYVVTGDVVPLSTAQPRTATSAACRSRSDHVVTGGYIGSGEIVTQSQPFPGTSTAASPDQWLVAAQIAPPVAASGRNSVGAYVQAWVFCLPG